MCLLTMGPNAKVARLWGVANVQTYIYYEVSLLHYQHWRASAQIALDSHDGQAMSYG